MTDRARPPRRRGPGRDDHPRHAAQPQRARRQLVTELFERLEAAERDDAVQGRRDPVAPAGSSARAPTCPRRPRSGMEEGSPDDRPAAAARSSRWASRSWSRLAGPVRAGGIGIVAACRHRDRRRGRHLRAHRGQARAGRRDHLAHGPPPDEPAGRGAGHARRRGVQRHRGGGVRPGHQGGPGRRARRRRSPRSAPASPPAPPRGCASRSGSSTATCSTGSTPAARRWRR